MNRSRISSRIGTIDAAAAQKTRCIHNRARVKGCDRPFSVQKVQRDERSFIAHSAHGQELFQVSNTFTEGFVVSDFVTSDAVLPVAIVSLLTFAAVKFISYSQLEVARTALLTRHVPKNGATVLQLGGTTRDLFYYPTGTVRVTVAGKNLAKGLWEQAALQSKVPVATVEFKTESELAHLLEVLVGKGISSLDSVVVFLQSQEFGNDKLFQKNVGNVWKLLKPGGTFLFLQPKNSSLSGGRNIAERIADAHGGQGWASVNWDEVASPLNPHIIGVAVKPLTEFSADKTAFEQVMKKGNNPKSAQSSGFSSRKR